MKPPTLAVAVLLAAFSTAKPSFSHSARYSHKRASLVAPPSAQGCVGVPNTNPKVQPCGLPGTLQTPVLLQSAKFSTSDPAGECGAFCQNNTACESFAVSTRKLKSTCHLYSQPLAGMGYTQSAKGRIKYYEKDCIICNLFENGNFQDGSWNPWTTYGASNYALGVTSPGLDGSYAGTILGPGGTVNGPLFYAPEIAMNVGQEYFLSFDYMSTSSGCAFMLSSATGESSFGLFAGNEVGVPGYPITLNEWIHFSSYIVPLSPYQYPDFYIICENAPNATLLEFDNFILAPYSEQVFSANSTPTGPNLVKDPNFDSGTLDAYTVFNYQNTTNATIVQPGYNGAANALLLQLEQVDAQPYTFVLMQDLNTVPGTVYNVSLYILYNPSSSVQSRAVEVVFYTGFEGDYFGSITVRQDSASENSIYSNSDPNAGQWELITAFLAAQESTTQFTAAFGLVEADEGATSDLYVSDLQVVPLN